MNSDRDLIISTLHQVERRLHANRWMREITAGLSVVLLIPVCFKLLDLVTPFRGRTVILVLAPWIAASIAYLLWRVRGRGNLGEAAANLDHQAQLHDQMKTAYWFIKNPQKSEWIDAQIHRTAEAAGRIKVNAAYPRQMPRNSYVTAGLVVLLAVLNFLPLPWNHNWFLLQAAPAFQPSESQKALLKQTAELLQQMRAAGESEIAGRIEKIIQDLQSGEISPDQAIHQLAELQSDLLAGADNRKALANGLDAMAHNLAENDRLLEVAQAIQKGDLKEAAARLRQLSRTLDPDVMRQLQDILRQAGVDPPPGLEGVAEALKESAEAMKIGDATAALSALERTAGALDALSENMKAQDLKAAAAQQLGALAESLSDGEAATQRAARDGQPQTGGKAIDPKLQLPPDLDRGGSGGEGLATAGADSFTAANIDVTKIGEGGSQPDVPLNAQATRLDVQLVKAALKGQFDKDIKPDAIEEASKQDRSKLDFRNVPSALSPAQKDSLSQDRLPSKYRELIKQYFDSPK